MAAGDVWDYIFGSYVNAARVLPYINDGVIVIRRLNARGAGTKPRRLSRSERERKSGSMHALRVAHSDALWNTADSHGISNEVDKIGQRGDHEIGMRVSRHRWNRALQLGETDDAITGCDFLTIGNLSRTIWEKWSRSGKTSLVTQFIGAILIQYIFIG